MGSGGLDPALMSALRSAEHGKHRLLLESVRRLSHQLPHSPENGFIREGHELLSEAERRAPGVVADVLTLPQVGGWAARCLSMPPEELRSKRGRASLGYMCLLAATAALRAPVRFELTVPAGDRCVSLPGFGRLAVPGVRPGEWVRLRSGIAGTLEADHHGGVLRVRPSEREPGAAWEPVPRYRTVADGLALEVLLDTDEYLTAQFGQVTAGLAQGTFRRWADLLGDAWRILSGRHRTVAEGITQALRTLVPLPADDGGGPRSATSGWLWGAVALGSPRDAWDLAEILVHEFHHLALGALEDNAPLVGARAHGLHYAPWRDDPRPLTGLLHGTYANLAMAQFWAVESEQQADRAYTLKAETEFAWRHLATGDAIHDLEASGGLTEAGRAFLDGLTRRWNGLDKLSISWQAFRAARERTLEHRLRWRLAHVRPEASSIDAMAEAWASGSLATTGIRWPATRVVTERHPDSELRSTWVALGLNALHVDETAARSPLLTRPEVVVALHERIRETCGDPPPLPELLRWLSEIDDEA